MRNVSLSTSFDVHCRETPIVASLSPESNVELLLDLDNAIEVSSNPNSPLLFAIAFCGETNPGDLSDSLCREVILWSVSTSLPWLSNIIVVQVEVRSHFTFKLYHGLWITHAIMTHFVYMITQKWLVKTENAICSERKSWNDSYFSAESTFQQSGVNKTFTHVQEQKKAMSPRHSAHIPSSVKSP